MSNESENVWWEKSLGNVAGGRGMCRYCKQMHNNVSFHEVWDCEKNPKSNATAKKPYVIHNGTEIKKYIEEQG
jgi:hypothetical protein